MRRLNNPSFYYWDDNLGPFPCSFLIVRPHQLNMWPNQGCLSVQGWIKSSRTSGLSPLINSLTIEQNMDRTCLLIFAKCKRQFLKLPKPMPQFRFFGGAFSVLYLSEPTNNWSKNESYQWVVLGLGPSLNCNRLFEGRLAVTATSYCYVVCGNICDRLTLRQPIYTNPRYPHD